MNPQNPLPQPPSGGNYDFIINPAKPPRRALLPTNSMASRLLVVVGGIFLLVAIFVVISSLLKGSDHVLPALTAVGQQQQELLQLTGADLQASGSNNQAPTLSANGKNFAATVQLTVASAQSQLTTYLQDTHHKLAKNAFSLTLSKTLDDQLSNAASAGNFESTFDAIMKTQLQNYQRVLQQAYGQITGQKGRAMLSNDYDQANLLLTQLSSPAS